MLLAIWVPTFLVLVVAAGVGAAQADWPTLDENGNFHDVPNTVEDDFGYGGCGAGGALYNPATGTLFTACGDGTQCDYSISNPAWAVGGFTGSCGSEQGDWDTSCDAMSNLFPAQCPEPYSPEPLPHDGGWEMEDPDVGDVDLDLPIPDPPPPVPSGGSGNITYAPAPSFWGYLSSGGWGIPAFWQ